MRALGKIAREPTSVYLTGGATAVLKGWRGTTIDVDLRLEPDHELLKALSEWRYYEGVAPELYRYPALDRVALERSIEALFGPR